MRHCFLALIVLLCNVLMAQDYAPFDPDVSKRFENVLDVADDDYFFYPTLVEVESELIRFQQYYSTQTTSEEEIEGELECDFWGGNIGIKLDTTWLGNQVEYNNALKSLLLFNESGDSLNFNFNLAIGESATFYTSDTLYCDIEYVSKTEEMHLGVLDSCKTFIIQAYNSQGEPLPNFLTGSEIRLSKENGLHSFIDSYHFPVEPVAVRIKGQTNPLMGEYQMTFLDAYPWSAGDVIQYRSHHSQPVMGSGFSFFTTNYETLTVSERVEVEDSVFIYFSSELATVQNPGPETISGIYVSLHSPIKYKKQDLIVGAPHNYADRDDLFAYLFYREDDLEECGTDEAVRKINNFASYCDSCRCYGQVDGFGSSAISRSYKQNKGLVGVSYSFYGSIQDTPTKSIGQIYSNINGVECGSLNTLSTNDVEPFQIEVFPNPSNGLVTIQSEEIPDYIGILDLMGKQIFETKIGLSFQNDINLSELPAGVYILQIEYGDTWFTEKLIIR